MELYANAVRAINAGEKVGCTGCGYCQPCPAGVDIPGYIALINEKRYADAVRLIRKDNPFPSTCAFVCEHPCEARCRRVRRPRRSIFAV